jgi:hypothetical protein
LFKLVAQQGTFTDNNIDYKFSVNTLNQCDKEWKIILHDLLHAVPRFCLKDSRRVAKSHFVDRWTSIPDSRVEWEDAIIKVMDVKE